MRPKLKQLVEQWRESFVIASSIAGIIIALSSTGVFQLLEWAVLDQLFRLRPSEPTESRLVLVTIDESDLIALGKWPISDETLAQLIEKIRDQDPRVIGLNLYRDLPVEPGHQKLLDVFYSTPNLFGIEKVSGDKVAPSPVLHQLGQVGLADMILDADGKVRRGFMSIRPEGGQTQLSLAAKLALKYLQAEGITPQVVNASKQRLKLGQAIFERFEANDGAYVQANAGGYQVLLNYRGLKQSALRVSIMDVLHNRLPPHWLQDRIVLIGVTARSLNDYFYTPYSFSDSTTLAGVEIHAQLTSQIISAALDGRPLLKTWPNSWEWIWVFFWAEYSAILGSICLRRRWAVFGILMGGSLLLLIAYFAFQAGWWVPVVTPVLAIVGSAVVTIGYVLWDNLQLSRQKLQEYARSLEEKVKNRTLELEQRTLELQQKTEQLEHQTLELEKAKIAAEAANRAKSTFLANMSHELRTPLNAILGFTQIMARDGTLKLEHQQNLSIISRSGEYLLTLINNILDLSKIEAGRTTLNEKKFDLYRLLDDLEKMFRLRALDKGLLFNIKRSKEVPRYIYTDEIKLRQILINLLNNALKFTEKGYVSLRVAIQPNLFNLGSNQHLNSASRPASSFISNPRISELVIPSQWLQAAETLQPCPVIDTPCLLASNSHGEKICNDSIQQISQNQSCSHPRIFIQFEVEDTGPGIEPEELKHLFEAFTQTKTGRQAQEGTGLGLAISRQFVQMMGGQIQVKSRVGQGTTFNFNIEVKGTETSEISEITSGYAIAKIEPDREPERILIVDDQYSNRQLLSQILSSMGFKIQEATQGWEAIQIWEHWQPHLIWMDIRMPHLNGYEVTRRIRSRHQILQQENPQLTAPKIIALTANCLEEDRQMALQAGCDDFLGKPFRETDIFQLIHQHLGIDLVYEELSRSEPEQLAVNLTQICLESLAALPHQLLKDLEQATSEADMMVVDSLIQKIRDYNSALADELGVLAHDFEYYEILNLVQQAKAKSS
jgi:CHASE2 domain-containing sensor protein/CheY-like chemotaxis protein